MPRTLVLVDGMGWALGNLYGSFSSMSGVIVATLSDIIARKVQPAEFDLVHFTYWQHYMELADQCERAIVSVHHLVHERIDPVLAGLVMRHPNVIVVADAARLCLFGEMGLPVRLVPYGIDKTLHSTRTLEPERFTVGWLGREWNGEEYKRFRTIREAASIVGIDAVDGGHVIGEPVKYESTDDFFMAIDAYIVASYVDAGPLPALEALSRGIPVLTTPVGMMPMVITNGGNGLFHDGSVEGIANSIREARHSLHRHVSHNRVPDMNQWRQQHESLYAEVLA